jgi:hypothetical protein
MTYKVSAPQKRVVESCPEFALEGWLVVRRRHKRQSVRTVIKNYGLMWRRDSVFWGAGGEGNRGVLEGRHRGRDINFRDQIGVYVLYDEGRRAIYVGQAGQGHARLFKRLRSHQRDFLALRWHYFSWFGLLSVKQSGKLSGRDDKSKRVTGTIKSTLNEIEGVLIAAMEPPSNKQGARFRGIDRYRQISHSEADHVPPKQVRHLLDKINRKLDELTERLSSTRNC